MKHVKMFNASVTKQLTRMGLDSQAVLNACNAYRGSVKADPSKTNIVSETKLTGKVGKKEDGRKLTFSDKESYKVTTDKGHLPAPGQLLAISDALTKLTDQLGISLELTEFPVDVTEWLTETVAFQPVQGPEPVSA